MSTTSVKHQEIVKHLLSTKAVDFNAIGKAVAELGPSLATADEPWDFFCGTMRRFIILYRVNPSGNPVENLGELSGVTGELQG